jgi:GT2 family glycosyltransferase
MSCHPSVAAVMPFYNEKDANLQRSVDALLKQTLPLQDIILVDDCSQQALGAFSPGQKVRIVRNEVNSGISESRNVGARQVESEWILFMNCNVVPPPNWLQCLLERAVLHPQAGVLVTRVISHQPNKLLTRWRFRFLENPHTRTKGERAIPWFMGHLFLMRRTVFEAIGGFDKDLRLSKEDGDASARIRALGWEIWQVDGPDAICIQEDSVDLLARKCIRNRGWSLSPSGYPGRDLKPMTRDALTDQFIFLLDRLKRDLCKLRLSFLPYEIAIWWRSRTIILDALNRQTGPKQ